MGPEREGKRRRGGGRTGLGVERRVVRREGKVCGGVEEEEEGDIVGGMDRFGGIGGGLEGWRLRSAMG